MRLIMQFIFIFGCHAALAETLYISGKIVDDKIKPIEFAEITISNGSHVKANCYTDKDGNFSIAKVEPGMYKIVIVASGYDLYSDSLEIGKASSNKPIDDVIYVGRFMLHPTSHMLNEVKIVEKVLAVVQKDDTLEFNSRAYQVNPDADAIDLVRKMPTVDVTGSGITAQGEAVIKVMVDGKPFFGTDPFAALKNLPAEMIDKVQVYNEKSDQEQFTGFSEGNTSKTINIITRPEMRNGVFGKLYAGAGSDNSDDGKYGAGGSVNGFDGDRRVTLTCQSNNINEQNFTNPGAGSGGASGATETNAGGINFTDKWSDKVDVAGSYFFNAGNTSVISDLRKTFILPADSGQVYNQGSPSQNHNTANRFNARINYTADSMNSILWQPTIALNKSGGGSQMLGSTEEGSEMINQTSNNSNTNHTSLNLGNNLLLRHRFHKKGRTCSVSINASNSNNNGLNLRNTQNIYYNSPALSDTLQQKTLQSQNNWNMAGNATYTEPIGSHGLLKLEYNISYQPSRSGNNTYDYSLVTDSYSTPDTQYSNTFFSKNISHKIGSSYQAKFKKIEASIGLYYQFAGLYNDQTLPISYTLGRNFQNVLPVASLQYKISKTKNLHANYSASTQPPGIGELQNVVNNFNPLFLSTGNPSLRQAYTQSITLRYNSVNLNSKNDFSASISGNYIGHGVTSNTIVAANDTFVTPQHILLPAGSQLTLPENINGNSALNTNLSYGMPLTKMKCNLKFSLNAGVSHNPSIINSRLNIQNNRNGGFTTTLSSNISENIDFLVSSSTTITSSENSVNPQLNNTYVNESNNASLHLILWKGIVFTTNIGFQANSGLSAGYNQNYALWNMGIGKKILKKHLGDIRLTLNDILNQNNNIQHTVTNTYIQDSRSNVLQRYFLLVFTYKLREYKKPPAARQK